MIHLLAASSPIKTIQSLNFRQKHGIFYEKDQKYLEVLWLKPTLLLEINLILISGISKTKIPSPVLLKEQKTYNIVPLFSLNLVNV